MAKCNWDPSKHEGRPCPIHGSGMWDENILTRRDKIEKLKEKGYTQEEIEEELKDEKFDDDFDWEEKEEVKEEFDKDEEIEEKIDYENIDYPKGTSKEYTNLVNEKYKNALPVLKETGINIEDFGGKPSAEGGYEDNTKEIMEKFVFDPFRKKYPNGNNEVWAKEYQPLFDAIEAVLDKNYNDWYIKERSKKEVETPKSI